MTIYAGGVAAPLGARFPAGAFPFRDGSASDWWQPDAPPPLFPLGLPLGPVVRLTRVTDWMGDAFVLTPPPHLCRFLNLTPARFAGPLVWTDTSGAPAVALRTWRVRNRQATFAEPAAFVGLDLVVRPEVLERMTGLYGVPLRELRVIWRRPVETPPDK